jgi:ABC-type enterochelin transport system substrate-binding protein
LWIFSAGPLLFINGGFMESKELARLKDITTQLKGIEVQLRGQNKILKELVDQIMKINDIFGKQWHGDANATSNGDLFTVPPIVKAVELEKGDTNETEE